MAKRDPRQERMSAGAIAKVSGMRSRTVVPNPARDASDTVPPME